MSFLQSIIRLTAPSTLLPVPARSRLLALGGAKVGAARIYARGGYYGDLRRLSIGSGVFINAGVQIFGQGGVRIGDHVSIGPSVLIMTGSHEIGPSQRRAGTNTRSAVTIGDGSWIGARATIQGGVTIGRGCVIAPGAVVVSDCEQDGFYAGIPAVRKKDLPS